MRLLFIDTNHSSKKICEMEISSLAEAPGVGDTLILLPNEEYEKFYGYNNKTCTVVSRFIDYRDGSFHVYVD